MLVFVGVYVLVYVYVYVCVCMMRMCMCAHTCVTYITVMCLALRYIISPYITLYHVSLFREGLKAWSSEHAPHVTLHCTILRDDMPDHTARVMLTFILT